MVVLGFRPKASTTAKVENRPQEVKETETVAKKIPDDTKKGNPAENTVKTESQPNKGDAKAAAKKSTPQQSGPLNPSSQPKKKKATNAAQTVATSNWQKLKSLNTLKVSTEMAGENIFKSTATTPATKAYVPDHEWFGVSPDNLQSLDAIKSVGMLKTNVSALSLFPSPPPNTTKKKLSQASRYVALDCEMVGVGPSGKESALARVSLVNFYGQVLLDVYVKPCEKVVDFRTAVSGIKPGHITPFHEGSEVNFFGQPLLSLRRAQELVVPLIDGKLVIGHSLRNDFKALMLSIPHKLRRDTSQYAPFRKLADGRSPSLKKLAAHVLAVQIQENVHDSVEDARIAMLLYRAVKKDWESRNFKQTSGGEGKK